MPTTKYRGRAKVTDRWNKQRGRCYFCSKVMNRGGKGADPKLRFTREHLIPRCDGGMGGENIVLACYKCNTDKSNLNEEEYKIVLVLRSLYQYES